MSKATTTEKKTPVTADDMRRAYMREYRREYRRKNRDRINAYEREYRKKHPEVQKRYWQRKADQYNREHGLGE